MKYPRTYHLPFSPGATKDDKKLKDGWFEYYRGKEVVFEEKLDGENSCMNSVDVYARSHSTPTRSPWSKNLWDAQDGLYWKVKKFIGPNEEVFGENLYGEHSIHYDCLDSYFHIFAVNDGARWYSWDEVKEMSNILGIPHAPELYRTVITYEPDVEKIVNELMETSSYYNYTGKEGIVMRLADSFPITEFPHYVCKWVRPNHVQTDEHWTRNWKRAKLRDEILREHGIIRN